MCVQSCIPFIDLFQYIPECKNLIDGTSVLSKPYLLLPQDVVNSFLIVLINTLPKILLMTGKSVMIPLRFVHSHKLPFLGNFTISFAPTFWCYTLFFLRWPIEAKRNSISVLKHNNLLKNTTIFWTTQESFEEHNNLLDNATIFSRTQQSFREHNNRFGNTTVFSRTQAIFLMHNNLFQNTITFSDTQTQTKTQQN